MSNKQLVSAAQTLAPRGLHDGDFMKVMTREVAENRYINLNNII